MTNSKKETRESEPPTGKRPSVPILTSGIGTRIEGIAGRVGGKRSLAKRIGLSESQLHRIISGESKPKAEVVSGLVRLGFNANWILTGEGPDRLRGVAEEGAEYEAGLQLKFVAAAASALYELVEEENLEMTPAKFGRAVALAARLKGQNEELELHDLVREIVYIAM